MLMKANIICLGCLLLASLNVEAVTNRWSSASSGNWTNPANWNLGTVPTASEDVWHADQGNMISVTSMAEAKTLLTGNNSTSIIEVVSGGSLVVGGVAEIGNAGSDGIGELIVDGGSVSIGGDLEFGRFGATRRGVGLLQSGNITVNSNTALGGFNSASGNLTINDGIYTATNGFCYVGRTGDGTLTINDGILNLQTNGTVVFNALRVGTFSGNGTVNLHGGELIASGIIMDQDVADVGTATINLFGGTLQIEGAFASAIQLKDDAQIAFDGGVMKWKGSQLSTFTNFVASGFITWTNGGASMLTENWEFSWTNGTSVLYADFNDANAGYTTIWAMDAAAPLSGYDAFSNQFALTEGPLGDDDHDGLLNFGEYALNSNPTNGADIGQFSISTDGSVVSYAHYKLANDTTVVYRVFDRTNLLSGAANTNLWNSQTFGAVSGDYLIVSNHYNTAGIPEMFIYLQVEQD